MRFRFSSHFDPAGSHGREEHPGPAGVGVVFRAEELPRLEGEADRKADHRDRHLQQ